LPMRKKLLFFIYFLVAKKYSSFSPKVGGEKKYLNLFPDIY